MLRSGTPLKDVLHAMMKEFQLLDKDKYIARQAKEYLADCKAWRSD
jgi:hypothetical protein